MPDRPSYDATLREAVALRAAVADRDDRPETITVVDVAEPYAHLDAESFRALFLRDYDGPDWRIHMVWASGREVTMRMGGTAADGVGFLDYIRERDHV